MALGAISRLRWLKSFVCSGLLVLGSCASRAVIDDRAVVRELAEFSCVGDPRLRGDPAFRQYIDRDNWTVRHPSGFSVLVPGPGCLTLRNEAGRIEYLLAVMATGNTRGPCGGGADHRLPPGLWCGAAPRSNGIAGISGTGPGSVAAWPLRQHLSELGPTPARQEWRTDRHCPSIQASRCRGRRERSGPALRFCDRRQQGAPGGHGDLGPDERRSDPDFGHQAEFRGAILPRATWQWRGHRLRSDAPCGRPGGCCTRNGIPDQSHGCFPLPPFRMTSPREHMTYIGRPRRGEPRGGSRLPERKGGGRGGYTFPSPTLPTSLPASPSRSSAHPSARRRSTPSAAPSCSPAGTAG
jgi:hypothetical protein